MHKVNISEFYEALWRVFNVSNVQKDAPCRFKACKKSSRRHGKSFKMNGVEGTRHESGVKRGFEAITMEFRLRLVERLPKKNMVSRTLKPCRSPAASRNCRPGWVQLFASWARPFWRLRGRRSARGRHENHRKSMKIRWKSIVFSHFQASKDA